MGWLQTFKNLYIIDLIHCKTLIHEDQIPSRVRVYAALIRWVYNCDTDNHFINFGGMKGWVKYSEPLQV